MTTTLTSDVKDSKRRGFIRKALFGLATIGVTGLIVGEDKVRVLPQVRATSGGGSSGDLVIDSNASSNTANSGTDVTELDSTTSGAVFLAKNTGSGGGLQGDGGTIGTGVEGDTVSGIGVFGNATGSGGEGVTGNATTGDAVHGFSDSSNGVYGTSNTGVGVFGDASTPTTVPIVARGFAGQTADLQDWKDNTGKVLLSVNNKGQLSANSGLVVGSGGLIFFNSKGQPIALLDANGNFHVKGKVYQYPSPL